MQLKCGLPKPPLLAVLKPTRFSTLKAAKLHVRPPRRKLMQPVLLKPALSAKQTVGKMRPIWREMRNSRQSPLRMQLSKLVLLRKPKLTARGWLNRMQLLPLVRGRHNHPTTKPRELLLKTMLG
jgi:hypothetical protein